MRTTTVVIGAGHAGLAMSHCLTSRSIDHVVLERGEVANSWKTERWDSLRLLTPNWQSRLPGYGYEGADPDGFRTMPETIAFIERYARIISAPVHTHARVTSVRRSDDGYAVATDQGDWQCRTVVLATGACNIPQVPPVAEAVPPAIATLTSMQYRNPDQLEQAGVLVVGASASGVQIAEYAVFKRNALTGEFDRLATNVREAERMIVQIVDEQDVNKLIMVGPGNSIFGRKIMDLTVRDVKVLESIDLDPMLSWFWSHLKGNRLAIAN